jgi:uncharacterized membrane protein
MRNLLRLISLVLGLVMIALAIGSFLPNHSSTISAPSSISFIIFGVYLLVYGISGRSTIIKRK